MEKRETHEKGIESSHDQNLLLAPGDGSWFVLANIHA